MQNSRALLSRAVMVALVVFSLCLPAFAQTVKRNPDGTVEVMDDDTSYTPVQHSSSSSGGSKKAGKRSASRAHSSGGSGRSIGSYTRSMGGCTVHRNADGTIEVSDNDASTVHWSNGKNTHSGGGSSRAGKGGRIPAYTKHHGDVAVKRNADGTVEVTDTSSTTKRKH